MRVSVVIPTYNRRHLIGTAIDSAIAQDVSDVELIVVDDGSTDGTVDWLRDTYGSRVRVLPNAGRRGPAGGRNTGMRAATGTFIALLDSDDAFLPAHLSDALRAFERHPDVGLVFGRAQYEQAGRIVEYMGPNFERKLAAAPVDRQSDGITVFTSEFFTHLLEYGCWFNLSTVVLRHSAVGEGMNESLRISEDYEYWARLSRDTRFACLHGPQVRYALHEENISFEADASAAGHAPSLLDALDAIRAYPGLERGHLALIDAQKAVILFEWAYRARQHGRLLESLRLNARSMRYGSRMHNLVACAKTLALCVLPVRRSGTP